MSAGAGPAPVRGEGKGTTTAELRSTGTMGSWEPPTGIIVTIIELRVTSTSSSSPARRASALPARASLDVGEMRASGRACGLPSSIPTTRLDTGWTRHGDSKGDGLGRLPEAARVQDNLKR